MTEPRLDDPIMFRSNVTEEDLTRFQYSRVSSSPESLHVQFAVLGTVNILVAMFCGLLILGILRSKTLRNRPFDLYILSIAIPDFWSGVSCMFACLLSVRGSSFVSEGMCGYQSFFLNASVAANTWLNAVIVFQIHKLLRYSHARRRYFPPSKRQVICHAGCVYAYSIMWGVLCAMQKDLFGMPFQSHAYAGLYCIPMEEDGNSWFFYIVFLNGVFVLPAIYAVGALTHILWKGLLPKSGTRRMLALFLIRIIFLYFVAFVPVAASVLIGNFVFFDTNWGYYVPAVMTHLQGVLTTILCYYTNQEYTDSMQKVLRCNWSNDSTNELQHTTTSTRFFSWNQSRLSSSRFNSSQQSGSGMPTKSAQESACSRESVAGSKPSEKDIEGDLEESELLNNMTLPSLH